jgi:hypothetical protein
LPSDKILLFKTLIFQATARLILNKLFPGAADPLSGKDLLNQVKLGAAFPLLIASALVCGAHRCI